MQQYPLKEEHQIVKNMEQNSSSSNADFAVLLHNGSVGGQLISVSPVIRNKWLEIMFQENLRRNYLNARVEGIVL